MALLTLIPTPTASPTPIATPTQVPALALGSIEPASVLNNQPARLAILGAGFVDTTTYVVRIGGHSLSDVHVESGSALTATLPAGLCPGAYAATVQDLSGREASGGKITLDSVRTIVHDEATTALNIPLTGWTQRRSVALPPVQVEDSGCGSTDWRINLAVDVPTSKSHGKTLTPDVLTMRWSDGGTATIKLSHSGGDQEQGTLVIPRNGSTRLLLTPSLELEIPASAYVGSYSTTLSASFAD